MEGVYRHPNNPGNQTKLHKQNSSISSLLSHQKGQNIQIWWRPTFICERQHHFHRCTSTTHSIHKPHRNPSNQDQCIHKPHTHNLQQLHTTTKPINQHPIQRRLHHRPPHLLNRHTKLCDHRCLQRPLKP